MGVESGSNTVALARHYWQLGQYENALRVLGDATGEEIAGHEYWFVRAECLRRLGRSHQALEAAREGLTREPHDIGLLDSLGLALSDNGDFANADAAFTEALRIAPWSPVVLGHHAVTLARLERHDEAARAVEQLQTMVPASTEYLRTKAEVALLAGRRRDAEQAANELLALDPESASGHVILGNVAVRGRRLKPAAEAFAEAASLNPRNASVVEAARRTRVAAHPLLTPARFVQRYSRGKPRFAYLAIVIVLILLHQPGAALAFAGFWIVLMAVLPRLVRAYYGRKHGAL